MTCKNPKEKSGILATILCFTLLGIVLLVPEIRANGKDRGWWPQDYTIQKDDGGRLILKNGYYTFHHDLNKGGAITHISLSHGRVKNMVLKPIETLLQLEDKNVTQPYSGPGSLPTFSDLNDPQPEVSHRERDGRVIVTVVSRLRDDKGRDSGASVKTTYSYGWGYVKIHKEVIFPQTPVRIKNLGVVNTVLHPSLSEYGYRNGAQERVFANLWSWRSEIIQWRRLRPGTHFDKFLQTRHHPRYLVFANPGVEGLEWFAGDDLSQWDYQMTGVPGTSYCHVFSSQDPLGVAVSLYPVNLYKGAVEARGSYAFDYYLGVPILEGHAYNPWLNMRVHPNGGKWVSEEEIKQWAADGINAVVLHNDGPTSDGLFWRDGSYPPYPPEEMAKMDKVIQTCHKYGIKIAPYFSNHELFPTVEAYKKHGPEWMRIVDDTHENINWRYGYYMCLKSGWLDFLKSSIDRVLKNHDFDGVYYDWNLSLYCNNPLHVGKDSNDVPTRDLGSLVLSPTGHWDMDELIDLMEWTRRRVGPEGMVFIHNTLTPMFTTENFANYVLGMEFGYNKVSISFPKLNELPLEWNFVGARSRGAISGGLIERNAPRRIHKRMALTGLMSAVAPWRATPEAIEMFKHLRPLGDLEQYVFAGWKNNAVRVSDEDCSSAVYSRDGESYVLLGNFSRQTSTITCRVSPDKLPVPLPVVSRCEQISPDGDVSLNASKLTGEGESIAIPADGVVVIRLR